jgi:cell wall-associated NlpC family hydrolase
MHFLRGKKWRVLIVAAAMMVLFATSAFAANKVTAKSNVNLRKTASTSSKVVTVMRKGTSRTVIKTSKNGKWYKVKVNGKTGYVRSNYVDVVDSSESSSQTDGNATTVNTDSMFRANVCAMAKSLLGSRYVYGATGPNSFDCSGFCQYIYKKNGKTIPRTSSSQYAACTKVSKANLQPGDLVFFSATAGGSSVGHVGIYVGNDQMIHAANSNAGVITSSLSSTYYTTHYVGAGHF